MTQEEQIRLLAQVIVRMGERFNHAADHWQDQRDKAEAEDDSKNAMMLEGMMAAAIGMSNELRSDIEVLGTTVDEIYRLTQGDELLTEATINDLPEVTVEQRLTKMRKRVTYALNRAEYFQLENEALRKRYGVANQDDQDPGSN